MNKSQVNVVGANSVNTWNACGRFGLLLCIAFAGCSPDKGRDDPADARHFDIVFIDGTIVDGTGRPAFNADLAILGNRIVAIGDLAHATSSVTINASGLVIAPGFIDVHSHADRALADDSGADMEGFLRQGVTTSVYGVDGFGPVESLRKYRELGEANAMGVNAMAYIGHNSVRSEVMGMEDRAPSVAELDRMRSIVSQGMREGAVGLSSGLMYLPGSYANTRELVDLAKGVAPFDGAYDSHIRDPARSLLESHQECLDIAAAAGVRAHPAHMKAVGGLNFGKGPDLVDLVQSGIDGGQDVTVDLYPYDGAATRHIVRLLHPADDDDGKALTRKLTALQSRRPDAPSAEEVFSEARGYWSSSLSNDERIAGGRRNTEAPPAGVFSWIETVGYDSLRVVVSDEPAYEGRIVSDLAREIGVTPFRLLVGIVADGSDAMVTLGAIMEEDIRLLMTQPWAMIASDGEEVNVGHPRGRGTFARVLGRYVREWRVLTLEEAVRKMSGLPAQFLRLDDRGIVSEGAIADIAVFDPLSVIDRATWAEPTLYAEGVTHVLIGGEFALRDGKLTGNRLGRFIPFAATQTK
jgi:N-acyl-D-aspartate/D-glutamate deacylase